MTTQAQPDPGDAVVQGAVPPSEQDTRTRNRLLSAAVQVFDRKGYDAASVREIVELAKVTKPALYYHFGSKEGVLLAILHDAERQFDEAMARAVVRRGSTRERITAMCEELYGLMGLNVPVIRVAHSVALGPSEVAPSFDFTVFERSMAVTLAQIIQEGQASGEVRPGAAEDIAMGVMGVISIMAGRQLHRQRPEQVGIETLRRVLDLVVFDGILGCGTGRQAAGDTRQ